MIVRARANVKPPARTGRRGCGASSGSSTGGFGPKPASRRGGCIKISEMSGSMGPLGAGGSLRFGNAVTGVRLADGSGGNASRSGGGDAGRGSKEISMGSCVEEKFGNPGNGSDSMARAGDTPSGASLENFRVANEGASDGAVSGRTTGHLDLVGFGAGSGCFLGESGRGAEARSSSRSISKATRS